MTGKVQVAIVSDIDISFSLKREILNHKSDYLKTFKIVCSKDNNSYTLNIHAYTHVHVLDM